MKLDKLTVAVVALSWHGWSVPKLLTFIEGESVFFPEFNHAAFVLDRVKPTTPISRLVDMRTALYLTMVVPVSSISRQVLLFLLSVEMLRPDKEGTGFEIDIVGAVNKSAFGQKERYGLLMYPSVEALVSDVAGVVRQENAAEVEELKQNNLSAISEGRISGLQNTLFRRALLKRLNRGDIKITLDQESPPHAS